jgi:uncharacterized membrane protein
MLLLFLLALLGGPYVILGLVGRRLPALRVVPEKRARLGLSLFFAFTALGHFVRTEEMAAMLPPSAPYRVGLIYLTGVFELAGAVGLWVPRLRRTAGLCLILLLVAVLPANVYSTMYRVEFGGHGAGPAYLLVRVPFQLFVIWWTYYATLRRPAEVRRREAVHA